MAQGILPSPPPTAFFYNGKKFASYVAFKNSPQFAELKTDARMRTMRYKLEARAKESRQQEALKLLGKWNTTSFMDRKNYDLKKEAEN